MPPAYVKPYVKRGKNEAVDAEAMTRPTMRFVAMKAAEQQASLWLHRSWELLVQRTKLVNMFRGLLPEFGIDLPESLLRALCFARQIAAQEVIPDVSPESDPVYSGRNLEILKAAVHCCGLFEFVAALRTKTTKHRAGAVTLWKPWVANLAHSL